MVNENIPDIVTDHERDRIFASDEDPIEALAEFRRSGEVASPDAAPAPKEGEVLESDELAVFEEEEAAPEPEPESEPGAKVEDEGEKEGEEVEAPPPQLYKFKANGQDFEFTQDEINQQFGTVFGKAMDYTQKMQKISPYRQMISALEEENITQDQLNLAIDVLKGDKAALQKLIADKDIDIYDLGDKEEDAPYVPNTYGKDEHQQRLEELDRTLSKDPEYAQTVDIVGRQWDAKSREALSDNPEWIVGLHSDVKSGVFAKVAPEATKMKMLDGGTKSDIEYYLMAGQRILGQGDATPPPAVEDPVKKATQQYVDDSTAANKKRAASSTPSRAGSKSVVDYLDDNDENFDAWYKNIMNNS